MFQAQASVAAIFLYVGAYQLSFGPIAWLLVGEVFPSKVRSAAVGVATLSNFGSNFWCPPPPDGARNRRLARHLSRIRLRGRLRPGLHVLHRHRDARKTLEDIETELTRDERRRCNSFIHSFVNARRIRRLHARLRRTSFARTLTSRRRRPRRRHLAPVARTDNYPTRTPLNCYEVPRDGSSSISA